MADVVTRLVVESKEYDSKIARATSGLTQFEKKCREVGGTLEFVEKEDLDFVKALGQMDTVASTATGKLGELKKAFTELSVQYKNLTDEEKKSPYGQALAGSLEQIKGRIGELGGQLSEVGKEMQTNGSLVDRFADSLGQLGPAGQMAGKLLKGAFGPVGIAIAVVVGVVKQLVDAFKRNEDAMASAERAAAPFKAIWQSIQQVFDKLVPYIAEGMEKIANVMQGVFNKFTGWIEKLGNTALGKKLGLAKVAEQMKNVAATQNQLTQSNKQIADSENALNKMRRSATVNNAKDEKDIAKLRAQASEKDKFSAAERVTMLEKAASLEEGIMQRNIAIKKKELEVIRLKNSLTQSGTEDLQAEADAEAAVLQAETEFYNRKRALARQTQAAKNEDAKDQAGTTDTGASKVKDAAAMWSEYTQKIEETKARLAEFKAMMEDMNLTQEQRDWAAGMADAYQEQLDKMVGATEEAVDEITTKVEELPSSFEQMKESLSNLSSGVGAISTLGNAFNDLKGIGEDLASAFSGEMDSWDALMTVFNSGISIMQTVIGVMEAINTLQELSSALSKKKVAEQTVETTTVVAGKGAEAAAETAEATASGAATAANTAEAAAGAGKAMAGIPIVGPVLAIAAIAAVLAAVLAATSKAKSAGKFAQGGVVGGNSYSGDRLMAYVNSGETILTPSQADKAMAGIQGNPMQNLQLSTEISGTNLRIVMNNDNRSKGGSRGYYANIH